MLCTFLMAQVHGYTGNHWMPPSGKDAHCIALAAGMVINFGSK
jgi:hypothetical protein